MDKKYSNEESQSFYEYRHNEIVEDGIEFVPANRKDKEVNREIKIQNTSMLGIIMNISMAVVKILIGIFSHSIAIISEGINNATDIFSSLLTLIGSKLAGKHPDERHPFGYGRVEYLTSLIIAVVILVTGIETCIESVKRIFVVSKLQISYVSLIIIAITAVFKFIFGVYAIKIGKETKSTALEGVGIDSRNDTLLSLITITSSIVFMVSGLSIDAYAGIIISMLIIKAGVNILIDTIAELLGRPGEEKLAKWLYNEILSTPFIINAADMMLHNYGPDKYSGSVNIEVDHEKTVGDLYQVIHELQLRIMHEKHVTMVFGVYAVDNDHEDVKKLRAYIENFTKPIENIKNYHAVYLEPNTDKIYCDFVVDYKLRDWSRLREQFLDYMKMEYPNNPVELTIETEFV